jgi:predicted nucleic acid-binding protein
MNVVFADSFFYLAFLSRTDRAHERTLQVAASLTGRVVTTAWVLTE